MIKIQDNTIQVSGGFSEVISEILVLLTHLSKIKEVKNLSLSDNTTEPYHKTYNEFVLFINKVYEIMGDSDEDRDDD